MFTNRPKIPDSFKIRATLICPTMEETQWILEKFWPVFRSLPVKIEFRSEAHGFYDRFGD